MTKLTPPTPSSVSNRSKDLTSAPSHHLYRADSNCPLRVQFLIYLTSHYLLSLILTFEQSRHNYMNKMKNRRRNTMFEFISKKKDGAQEQVPVVFPRLQKNSSSVAKCAKSIPPSTPKRRGTFSDLTWRSRTENSDVMTNEVDGNHEWEHFSPVVRLTRESPMLRHCKSVRRILKRKVQSLKKTRSKSRDTSRLRTSVRLQATVQRTPVTPVRPGDRRIDEVFNERNCYTAEPTGNMRSLKLGLGRRRLLDSNLSPRNIGRAAINNQGNGGCTDPRVKLSRTYVRTNGSLNPDNGVFRVPELNSVSFQPQAVSGYLSTNPAFSNSYKHITPSTPSTPSRLMSVPPSPSRPLPPPPSPSILLPAPPSPSDIENLETPFSPFQKYSSTPFTPSRYKQVNTTPSSPFPSLPVIPFNLSTRETPPALRVEPNLSLERVLYQAHLELLEEREKMVTNSTFWSNLYIEEVEAEVNGNNKSVNLNTNLEGDEYMDMKFSLPNSDYIDMGSIQKSLKTF